MNQPKKELGQHWLHDKRILQSIVAAAELSKTDTVLEIGPGKGTLTELLQLHAKSLIALEFDQELIRE